ncbi:hypothetical protein DBR32_04770 [Taibaiella sp. KBW10]|uniref:hypothetical protein n=1 Tax=Taibaiella sp. KBW10 TaxID=2153357 RepID=UPI000F593720|nr:hypothetical protein [Taibaiella sp. KBW10]RQO31284.1 hypothetical protein DBR32_04770 [Taibaiella sp. KBW10]
MDFLLIDTITNSAGKLYLFIRYRNPNKRRKIFLNEYEGSYTLAGKEALLWVLALIVLLIVVGLIVLTVSNTFIPRE